MEKHNFSRNAPPSRNNANMNGQGPSYGSLQLRPEKAPNPSYTFGNVVAVSPLDIPPPQNRQQLYLIINGRFVLTARPLQGFPQGYISLSDPQRTWAQIALTDTVNVQAYDPFRDGGGAYLASLDVSVAFAGRKTTETPYDQDELADIMLRQFDGQVLAPGQQILMDHQSIPLRLIVKTVQLGDVNMMEKGGGAAGQAAPQVTDPTARGLLVRNTAVNFFKDARNGINVKASNRRPAANAIIQPDFKFADMGIGGLDKEFSTIFRKAFASRIFPPGLIERLGVQHVKGILMYGPPGTGKTLIARQIGKMLNAREPKVINGPEVLNKYVGQSEENIRKLFADAEKEYKEKGDESGLHIIIFDELDAVCKQRGSGSAGGTGVGDSVVNQLLSKLDGVDQLNNILLIGMTNRKDMIDDALLRPGRLEVHLEISLPDESGRVQILNIHTDKMRHNNLLARDVDIAELAAMTKNFSGAEISGLVRAATSFAFARHTKAGSMAGIKDNVNEMQITRDDFMHGLEEIEPAFGVSEESLTNCFSGGMLHYSSTIDSILSQGADYVSQVREQPHSNLLSVIFHGPRRSGKTALAAKVALDSQYPFIRYVSPGEDMRGFSESAKINHLNKIFADAHKSALSVVVLDNIERLIEWSPIGPRFSNPLVVELRNMMSSRPPKGRKLLVLATTSDRETLARLELLGDFDYQVPVPCVQDLGELARLLELQGAFDAEGRERAMRRVGASVGERELLGIGVKDVLLKIDTSMNSGREAPEKFADLVIEAVEVMRLR